MGVKDLTAFLLKQCPDVIKEIPARLRELSGKTIVIDATLLTQRLHYSPSSIHNHHVLRWYRLISELKSNGVNVICVFDGKERHAAKIRELERRREGKATSLARGKLEEARLLRLRAIHPVVRDLNQLSSKERGKVAESLRDRIQEAIEESKVLKARMEAPTTETIQKLSTEEPDSVPLDQVDEPLRPGGMEVESDLPLQVSPPPEATYPAVPQWDPSQGQQEIPPSIPSTPSQSPDDRSLSLGVSQSDTDDAEPSKRKKRRSKRNAAADITSSLTELFGKYRKSLSEFEALRAPLPASNMLLHSPEPFNEIPSLLKANPEFRTKASKNQFELAAEEGKEWQKLITDDIGLKEHVDLGFQSVIERSEVLSESYRRRNEYPTDQTYEDARQLLLTMGVPCVQSEAPYEGEGLASAIVLKGHADFVVSEDMDVVLYGAPLLRNITDKNKPLWEIAGADIPEALELSRDAFVDFGLLCGTDFTRRIPNVGPNRSFKFMKEYGSVEKMLKNEKKYQPSVGPEEYLKHVASARHIFNTLPPVPNAESLQPRESDPSMVNATLERFGLHAGMVEDDLNQDFFSLAFQDGNDFGVDYFADK
ncbi:hypothetical protein FRC17_000475 [Serendipita sp. 399]|nr:hypothetical protein FRC17_000475 [Serendipita sp. 399]